MIDKQKITDPQQWQLIIELSDTMLTAITFCPQQERSLQTLSVPLPPNAHTTPGALDELVYNNPGLTDNFGRVTVLWRSERFAVMPGFVTEPGLPEKLLRVQFPEEKWNGPAEILVDTLAPLDMRIAYEVPARTLAFVRRTFNNPAIYHPLTIQALWFAAKNDGRPSGKTFANLTENTLDIVVLGHNPPLMVNSFSISDPVDAVYYLLAARRVFDLAESDEIILAGTSALRASVSSLLRRYVGYVMPAIIPAGMLKMGSAVTAVPFELSVTPEII